jgi:hypothetical protein
VKRQALLTAEKSHWAKTLHPAVDAIVRVAKPPTALAGDTAAIIFGRLQRVVAEDIAALWKGC